MLNAWQQPKRPDSSTLDQRLMCAKSELSALQIKVKESKIPVIVLLDGWGAAGKGSVLGKIIKNLDPRFFKVETIDQPSAEEKRKPFLYRYFKRIPEEGRFTFFDGGWMDDIVTASAHKKFTDTDYQNRIVSIKRFERTLHDNGYLVLKFFFHITKEEQKERLGKLLKSKDTKWRVSKEDCWQNKHYEDYFTAYDHYLNDTDQSYAPWYIIDSTNKKWAQLQLIETINQGIRTAMANRNTAVPILQNVFPLENVTPLADIDLAKELSEEEYRLELEKYQKELKDLQNRLYLKKIPVIIAYEGWDAAGKGGNIKRIASALDPRGYEVQPIASPEPHEKARHFLWRFWTRLPKTGHITIFDRTWYGRVMVERLEGFCTENDWKRAYNEINEFEKELIDWGAIVIKFWVQIDKDTQLARFTERQNTPEKQWKITDEDWRNREKWDEYETAVNEMIEKTSTTYAPWHILESNDKKYARIKALKIVIKELKKRL